MKHLSILFFCLTALLACQTKNQEDKKPVKENKKTTLSTHLPDTIILYEDQIRSIALPFDRKEMLDELKKAFEEYSVTKETGHQDGPDFKMYVIRKGEKKLCHFGMDWNDSLSLFDVTIQSPLIRDEYGLKVGDSFQKIKKLRNRPIELHTIFNHQHVYAYVKGSHIRYEINGPATLPDTINFETFQFTEEQVKDWKIERLIWRKH